MYKVDSVSVISFTAHLFFGRRILKQKTKTKTLLFNNINLIFFIW